MRTKQNDFSELQDIHVRQPLAIVVFNHKVKGVIKKTTPEFCVLFGYFPEELLTKPLSIIFPELYDTYYPNIYDKAL